MVSGIGSIVSERLRVQGKFKVLATYIAEHEYFTSWKLLASRLTKGELKKVYMGRFDTNEAKDIVEKLTEMKGREKQVTSKKSITKLPVNLNDIQRPPSPQI